ncbi:MULTISPECIES: DedA family protein [Actinomadura]|uniref:DedA family protein n=1 Tax=Actinomadura yumaensis TaxID=111807 RepID=A0ABW2CB09_9ACTN|nr:DedA family protein [Actinomadura sp. J1-007]MWK33629.1 DedA family protein [Actinomadura sp. J1-007]
MLENFNALVDGLPPALIYLLIAALVFAEAALFFGFLFPGETAIVVGGVLASQDKLSLPLLLVLSIVAAVAGDSVGYEIGRKYGTRLLDTRAMRKHRAKVVKAQDLIRRRGAVAVFIGRFTALLRALMPALVGSSKLPYPKFLVFNVIGGVTWVLTFTLGGYFAGEAFDHAAKLAGRGLAVGIAVLAVAALIVWGVRKHRRENAEEAEVEAEEAAEGADRSLEQTRP